MKEEKQAMDNGETPGVCVCVCVCTCTCVCQSCTPVSAPLSVPAGVRVFVCVCEGFI